MEQIKLAQFYEQDVMMNLACIIQIKLSKLVRYTVNFNDVRYKFNEHANYLAWSKISDLMNSILGYYKKQRRNKKIKLEPLFNYNDNDSTTDKDNHIDSITVNDNLLHTLLEKKTISNNFNLAMYYMICDVGLKRKVLPSVFNRLKETALQCAPKSEIPIINLFTCDGEVHYNVEKFKPDAPSKKSIDNITKSKAINNEVAKFYQKVIKLCVRYKVIVGGYILGEDKDSVVLEVGLADGFQHAIRYTFMMIKAFPDYHIEYKVVNCDNIKKKTKRLDVGKLSSLEELDNVLSKWYDKKRKSSKDSESETEKESENAQV